MKTNAGPILFLAAMALTLPGFAQELSPYGHLFEGDFQPFVPDASLSKSGSKMSENEIWAMLREIDQVQMVFSQVVTGPVRDAAICKNKLGSLREMIPQMEELRSYLVGTCSKGMASVTCASYRDQWGRLASVSQGIAQRFAESCSTESLQNSNAEKTDFFKAGTLLKFEKSSEAGNSQHASVATSRASGGLAAQFGIFQENYSSAVDAKVFWEDGTAVHDGKANVLFRSASSGLGIGVDHDLETASGHWLSGSNERVSLSSLRGRYGLESLSASGYDFWELVYHPQVVVSTGNTYSKISHGLSLEFGDQKLARKVKSSNVLFFVKEFASKDSVMPDTQSVSFEKQIKSIGLGASQYLLNLGVKEVRDSLFTVRLVPVVYFEIFEEHATGLQYQQNLASLSDKQFHDSAFVLDWNVDSTFESVLSQRLLLKGAHSFHFTDAVALSFSAGFSHRQNLSKVISGDLQSTGFWQAIGVRNQIKRGMVFNVDLKFTQELMNDPAEAPLSRAWLRPASSGRGIWAEAGLLYEF